MFLSTFLFFPFLVISILLLKNYPLTFQLYRLWGMSICFFMGVFPSVKGKENLPKKKGYIMVANHTSQLDIITPYALLSQHFAFLAKKELEKLPLFRINFRGMNVTVDRRSMVSGMESLSACTEKLKNGINLLIFPEGTRSKMAPEMMPFKNGPFQLAIENNTPIVPMVFLDNYKRFPADFKSGIASPGKSRMVILPTIDPSHFMDKDNPVLAMKQYTEECMNLKLQSFLN
jgi:1-acyl-sn-glycerol-3-phosphate acyltransferase